MSSESDSPEVQKAKTFFQYGNDAAHKSNFDYAINMYREACKLVPDNMVYRQSLRGVQRKKFQNDPAKVGKLVGMTNQPILMKARSARDEFWWIGNGWCRRAVRSIVLWSRCPTMRASCCSYGWLN